LAYPLHYSLKEQQHHEFIDYEKRNDLLANRRIDAVAPKRQARI